jgi:hypothetical protein
VRGGGEGPGGQAAKNTGACTDFHARGARSVRRIMMMIIIIIITSDGVVMTGVRRLRALGPALASMLEGLDRWG